MSYKCINNCYWGPEKSRMRYWTEGEIFNGVPTVKDKSGKDIVNPHFVNMDPTAKVEVAPEMTVTTEKAEVSTISVPDGWEDLTKKQINEKYELGLDKNMLTVTNRAKLLEMVQAKVG